MNRQKWAPDAIKLSNRGQSAGLMQAHCQDNYYFLISWNNLYLTESKLLLQNILSFILIVEGLKLVLEKQACSNLPMSCDEFNSSDTGN